VLGTGWFSAVAAGAGPDKTSVVGDGAVRLLAILAAAPGGRNSHPMRRHEPRQQSREYGATDILTERGDEGVAVGVGEPGRPKGVHQRTSAQRRDAGAPRNAEDLPVLTLGPAGNTLPPSRETPSNMPRATIS
jgi:hypothetical protein